MDLKLFTDLIDALTKVSDGIKALADIPKKEKEMYRQTMADTFRLIDTTLNMVIIRLGDILLLVHDNKPAEFMGEVVRLDNYNDWLEAERAFRICASLRAAVRDTEDLRTKLKGKIAVKDWDELLHWMNTILLAEGEIALFLSHQFYQLSEAARTGSKPIKQVEQDVRVLRQALIDQRHKLIQKEIDLYSVI